MKPLTLILAVLFFLCSTGLAISKPIEKPNSNQSNQNHKTGKDSQKVKNPTTDHNNKSPEDKPKLHTPSKERPAPSYKSLKLKTYKSLKNPKFKKTSSFEAGILLVGFEKTSSAQKKAALKYKRTKLKKEIKKLAVMVIKVPKGQERSYQRKLEKRPGVLYVERNVKGSLASADECDSSCHIPTDPKFSYQWGPQQDSETLLEGLNDDLTCCQDLTGSGDKGVDINAPYAWKFSTGSAVRVAVVDSGIGDNPDLSGKVLAHANFSTASSAFTTHAHGTHVSDVIGAKMDNAFGTVGIAPNALLLNARVADDNGVTSCERIAQGITWSADQGAQVINLSVIVDQPCTTLENAVNYAWQKGALLVAAAGNNGSTNPYYPAAYPEVVSVAAYGASGIRTSTVPSNWGASWVDLGAPGENIAVMGHGIKSGRRISYTYNYVSGTSFAAPHVAGTAALVWALVPDSNGNGRTNDEVGAVLQESARPVYGTGDWWKYGSIDTCQAVKRVSGSLACPEASSEVPTTPTGIIKNPSWVFSSTENDGAVYGAYRGQDSGHSPAPAGDVNGDGLGDFLYASPRDSTVFLILGSRDRLTVYTPYLLDNSYWYRMPPNVYMFQTNPDCERISSTSSSCYSDQTGIYYTSGPAGDFNGDGFDDIYIGAMSDDQNGRKSSSSVYIVHGPITSGQYLENNPKITRIDGPMAADAAYLGWSVSTGDTNGDGLSDILMACPFCSPNGRSHAGSVYVVYGKPGGASNIDLANPPAGYGYRIDGAKANDWLGGGQTSGGAQTSIATIPDLNGDGTNEIALGAPQHTYRKSSPASGAAYLVFGQRGTASVDLANLGTSGYSLGEGTHYTGKYGYSIIALPDGNGDGKAEIAVGAPGESSLGRDNNGAVYIWWGKGSTTALTPSSVGTNGVKIEGNHMFYTGGHLARIGDVNGDSREDFLVDNYIFYGKRTLKAMDIAAFRPQIDGFAAYEFNFANTIGDINGDSHPDLMFSNTQYGDNSGAAWLYYGFTQG